MLHDFDVRRALRKFSEETKLIESMVNAFIKAGATEEEAKEAVERITKNSVLDAKNLLRNVAIEQANTDK